MTKTPWTPGPWIWDEWDTDPPTIECDNDADRALIAEAPAMADALDVLAHWFNQSEERRLDTIATARAILARIKGEPQ